MKPWTQYPGWKKCPRCRSGDVFEIENYKKEPRKPGYVKLAEWNALPKLQCRTCEYTWAELAA